MSFSLVGHDVNFTAATGPTIATTNAIDVNAGDLIFVQVSWYDSGYAGDTTCTVTDNGSLNDMVMKAAHLADPDAGYMAVGYKLNAANNDAAIFTATLGANRVLRSIHAFVFRSSGTITERDYKSNTGSSTSFLTSNLTSGDTGTDVVLVSGVEACSSVTFTAGTEHIGETDPTGSYVDSRPIGTAFYLLYTSGSVNGFHGQGTLTATSPWAGYLIAFNCAAGGGGRTALVTRGGNNLGIMAGMSRRMDLGTDWLKPIGGI